MNPCLTLYAPMMCWVISPMPRVEALKKRLSALYFIPALPASQPRQKHHENLLYPKTKTYKSCRRLRLTAESNRSGFSLQLDRSVRHRCKYSCVFLFIGGSLACLDVLDATQIPIALIFHISHAKVISCETLVSSWEFRYFFFGKNRSASLLYLIRSKTSDGQAFLNIFNSFFLFM